MEWEEPLELPCPPPSQSRAGSTPYPTAQTRDPRALGHPGDPLALHPDPPSQQEFSAGADTGALSGAWNVAAAARAQELPGKAPGRE